MTAFPKCRSAFSIRTLKLPGVFHPTTCVTGSVPSQGHVPASTPGRTLGHLSCLKDGHSLRAATMAAGCQIGFSRVESAYGNPATVLEHTHKQEQQ